MTDDPNTPLRLAAFSLWSTYQFRLGKSLWSIGEGSHDGNPAIHVMGTKECLRTMPDEWEGFPVIKRETGPMMMCYGMVETRRD